MAKCATDLCQKDATVIVAWSQPSNRERETVVYACRACADGYMSRPELAARELTSMYINPMYGVYRGEA